MSSDLLDRIASGDRRALARGLSSVEDRAPGFRDLLRGASGSAGAAHRVGLTGAPGVGKSTLVSALTTEARKRGRRVAILAIDPSSPFTGGALLGDRVRMTDHLLDQDVFVRSMASRGAQGGLSTATGDALDLLDAAGFDLVLVETVGAGQGDVDVAAEAETTCVLFAPGAGDAIQAMKSGLMEVADLWVVNKADDDRAERVRADILSSLMLHDPPDDLDERVRMVSASTGSGVAALLDALDARLDQLEASGARAESRRERIRYRVGRAAAETLREATETSSSDALVDDVLQGRSSVHDAAEALLRSVASTSSGEQP
ncbi:MAG: methylmalonyl Co-A mutase-associated GTPase MeaB [Planctomycetes bacterium]|nr:methylmalonyl Co-A mutase-associated GTPase MeaB [Planctomycetota bacterium]